MEVTPKSHPVTQLEFDAIIGADGRRNTLPGTKKRIAAHLIVGNRTFNCRYEAFCLYRIGPNIDGVFFIEIRL